jgi:hypothetical protein
MQKDLLYTKCSGDAVFNKEKECAKSCIDYYNHYLKNDTELIDRQKVYELVASYYSKLKIEIDSAQMSCLKDSILNPETIFLEVAHNGQIPHLGIVRLVLKTYQISTLIPNSLVIYFIGDHYSADMSPESTLFGIPQMGVSPNQQKNPVVFKLGRNKQHIPLKWINSPSTQMIDDVESKVKDWIINNVSYEKKHGVYVRNPKEIEANLSKITSVLRKNASIVDDYGNWMIRVQYELFKDLMGDEVNKIIFLPFSGMTNIAKNHYINVLDHTREINNIKEEASRKQSEAGMIPYQKAKRSEDTVSFWLYCPECKRRSRPQRLLDGTLSFKCHVCNTEVRDSIDNLWDIVMPDIVAFENAYFRIGIGGWVVGSKAPYQEIISEVYKYLYGSPMPPRFLLDSIPVFRGVGDHEKGYGRTTLMRALMEISAEKLFTKLMSPWNDSPYIESDYLVIK